jgi:hypothetical protein
VSVPPYFILFFGWKYFKGTSLVILKEVDLQSNNINLDGSIEEVEPKKSRFARILEYVV